MTALMDKCVVVVGGSSGIGLGVAQAVLAKGAELVIVGRLRTKLQAAERMLAAHGRVRSLVADVTRQAEVERLFDEVGAFDHLVSTAGSPPPGDPLDRIDFDVVRRFVDDKLIGAVVLAKFAVRALTPGGSMTFTSGINKDRPPVPGGAVVAAIAGSFSNLAHALSLELAPTRVNVVSPGWVDTPMFTELAGEAKASFFESMAKRLPAGRIAAPADIAPAYIYAMESDFTTGETIHIDGGQRLI